MSNIPIDVDANIAVAVNSLPLVDDTDFKSIEDNSVPYNAAGLELIWHFITTAGVMTSTPVTPTTGGDYDWSHSDGGVYKIEIPASGGASINNDTEGSGWFTGKATGVLPWAGPVYLFRAAGLNNILIDSAYDAAKGLAGTNLDGTISSVLSKLLKYIQLIARKDAAIATDNATELTAINANGGSGGGTFNNATDAEEALSDKLGTPAGASLSVDIAALQSSINLIAPITHTPNSVTLTTGTLISGTVANMQTDDNSRYVTAPAAGGLEEDLTFNIGLGYAPISVGINGYFNGAGQGADVWAYDAVAATWDKLTNTSTRMATRASDANYTYPLSHDHIDPATGDVIIRFTSSSTNGAHRLNLDRVLVATVDDVGAGATLTAAEIWSNPERTLTDDTGEPIDTAALATAIVAAIVAAFTATPPPVDVEQWKGVAAPDLADENDIAAAILLDPTNLISVNASNETKVGTVTVGDVVLAALQPNYDPIAILSAILGTPADTDLATDIANVAASIAGISAGDATAANQALILAAIAGLPVPGDATAATQALIQAAIAALGTPAQAGELVEGAITVPQALQAILAFVAGRSNGGGTPNVKFRDQANTKDRIALTVDVNGNRSATVLSLD